MLGNFVLSNCFNGLQMDNYCVLENGNYICNKEIKNLLNQKNIGYTRELDSLERDIKHYTNELKRIKGILEQKEIDLKILNKNIEKLHHISKKYNIKLDKIEINGGFIRIY